MTGLCLCLLHPVCALPDRHCHLQQVPFTLKDEDISEDWECKDNKWDRMYAACTMAQALTDEEIDGILAGQQDALEARPLPPFELETAETDNME